MAFPQIIDHYKNLFDTEREDKKPAVGVKKTLYDKFMKYKAKSPTKSKSVAIVLNRQKTKQKKHALSEEAQTKIINDLETGNPYFFFLIYLSLYIEAKMKDNELAIEKDLSQAQKQKLVDDGKKSKTKIDNLEEDLRARDVKV